MVDNIRAGAGVLGGEVSNVGIYRRVDRVVVVVPRVVSWVVSASLKDTVRR